MRGFEKNMKVLIRSTFERETLVHWKQECERKLTAKADELGLTVQDVMTLEQHEDTQRRQASHGKRALEWYFRKSGVVHDSDNVSEIHDIVDYIIEAAIAGAQAELLRQRGVKKTYQEDTL